MYWILIIASVNINGTVALMTQHPQSPKYNNETSCKENGQKLADRMQVELGTKNSKVFWICNPISFEEIARGIKE